jgi:colanic acid/amylovoran biosynthesis glycosyltransferase
LQALADEVGSGDGTLFTGALPQHEVLKILSRSHICLVPSVTTPDGQMEGIPVSIMEAMAAGLPVVSTRHSGIPELIENAVSGVLADERDVTGLANALHLLIKEPDFLRNVQVAGRKAVEEGYNARQLVLDLERIFEEEVMRR